MSRKKTVKAAELPGLCTTIDTMLNNGQGMELWLSLGFDISNTKPTRYGGSEVVFYLKNSEEGRKVTIFDNISRDYNSRANNTKETFTILIGVYKDGKKYYKAIDITSTFDTDWRNDHHTGEINNVTKNYNATYAAWFTDDKLHYDVLWLDYDGIMNEIKTSNPHLYSYCIKNNSVDRTSTILSFPEIEILDKAGFDIAHKVYTRSLSESELQMFNRTFKAGTSPKNIIQMPKRYYNELKETSNLVIWDNVRKLIKNNDVSVDAIKLILEDRLFIDNFSALYSILNAKWNNKNIFTVESLVAYLRRIDMYEAIDTREGLYILKDYLEMCRILHMNPKIDGDSLKREHDVAARLCRQKRDEILAEKMQNSCNKLQDYNYEEEVFLVRGIQSYDDLLDEAKQQHNCVASYAHSIIKGSSLIFVMRTKKDPNKSLITIELSPDGKTIRQKLLAYNQHIHNKAQTEFIERWHRKILNNELKTV